MAIRWVRNVCIDGKETTVEIQIGYKVIGDKCYTRVGSGIECYFGINTENRDDIVIKGKDLLRSQLAGRIVTYTDGRTYDWE
jgi:hypothetical protein